MLIPLGHADGKENVPICHHPRSVLGLPGRPRRRFKRKCSDNSTSSAGSYSQPLFSNGKLDLWTWLTSMGVRGNDAASNSPLILAVVLWYSLGVVSISTSKLLLTTSNERVESAQYYSHVGGVPPLVLTVQQLFLGSNFLWFLLQIRFMDSKGLQPWYSMLEVEGRHKSGRAKLASPSDSWTDNIALFQQVWQSRLCRYLVLAGLCFTLGFFTTNLGFSGSAASFVETIKAAEPITSASLAVSYGLEHLNTMEMGSLGSIVVGVLMSTVGNAHGQPKDHAQHGNDSSTLYDSFLSCAIVMTANLCFSYRGLYQKLFRADLVRTNSGSATPVVMDDLNLQFRMQQLGVWLLLVPTILWNGPGMTMHIYRVYRDVGLFRSGVALRYVALATINGLAFTCYNVVHHAALNCIRRIFAIVVTSVIFGVHLTFVGVLGILVSVGGFMAFSYAKAQKRKLLPFNPLPQDKQEDARHA